MSAGAAPRGFPADSPLLARPPAPPPDGRIKDDPETIIWPQELGDGRRAIVKLYRGRGALDALRARLEPCRVEREYRALERLVRSGVPCSVPRAWGRGRSAEHGRYELLATLEIPGARSLMHVASERAPGALPLDLAPLYRSVRRMHEGGVFHGALKLHNVLGAPGPDGALAYYVIDMPRSLLFAHSIVGTPAAEFDLLRLSADAARILGLAPDRLPLDAYGLDAAQRARLLARLPTFRATKGVRTRAYARARLARLGAGRVAAAAALVLALAALGAWRYYRPGGASVPVCVETEPVPSPRDAADDVALWIDTSAPEESLVLGTDKKGGLCVYGLDGRERQRFENGAQNNVDLRDGVSLPGGAGALAVTSATAYGGVYLYRVDPAARRLVALDPASFRVGLRPSGIALYRGAGGRTHIFVDGADPATGEAGVVEQWELRLEDGRLVAERVRRFAVGGRVEGIACDDALGFVFVSEEKVAVWRYGAEPGAGAERVLVERVGLRGRLRTNAEGIALYARPDGSGYLLVSSQSSNDFTVYERRPPHAYRGRFHLSAAAGIDAVSHTDGIEACSTPLGARFPAGLFVAQDDENPGANQNFKLASWTDVARAIGLE